MEVINATNLPLDKLRQVSQRLPGAGGLKQLLDWALKNRQEGMVPGIVSNVIEQDEFTKDVVIPFSDVFLVYDTT